MKQIILAISLLLVTIATAQIPDQICSTDAQCPKNGHFECLDKLCKCSAGYRKGNLQNCVYVLGTNCDSNDECQNMAGATCESSKCVCKAGSISGAAECLKIGAKGDPCTQSSECIQRHKDENTECRESACICKSGFHFNNQDVCVKSIGLDGSCSKDDDCYLSVGENNALNCVGGTCKCKENYKEENGTCNGSSFTMAFSITSILVLVLSMLKF